MDRPKDNCCRWIHGDVRSGTATWCGIPTRDGGPWCVEHRRVVYVGWRPAASAARRAVPVIPEA
ncbi:hypothetical protein [Magnetospirillum sp. SS-4]|uniref:hypothetical protein n=1 Tax=Magnetospirillum sp. SS-4 TaxID=2681465 RepID=UPI001573ABD7|nr:hypothetical protein [Magnetospirillum sp. SS-4]